jgi:hypothetical protein
MRSIAQYTLAALLIALKFLPLRTVPAEATKPTFEEMPKVDVHAHIFEEIPELVQMLTSNRVRIIIVCNRGLDGHLEESHRIAAEMRRSNPRIFQFESNWDLTRFGQPGYTNDVISWLDRSYENGAVGTKIWKEVGLELKRKDGSFVMPDDPVFDPIYEHMADKGKPLHAHLGEPIEAWLPLKPGSIHYGYYSNNPQWHMFGKNFPSHADIMKARDNIMRKHPRLTLIGAHFASLEHDLDGLAERLDRFPNFYIECAGRVRDLMQYPPEKVRGFFHRYQRRILYGVDMTWKPFLQGPKTPAQKAAFVSQLERRYRTDYRFFAASGVVDYEGRKVEALDLPTPVLESLFYRNAYEVIFKEKAPAVGK